MPATAWAYRVVYKHFPDIFQILRDAYYKTRTPRQLMRTNRTGVLPRSSESDEKLYMLLCRCIFGDDLFRTQGVILCPIVNLMVALIQVTSGNKDLG